MNNFRIDKGRFFLSVNGYVYKFHLEIGPFSLCWAQKQFAPKPRRGQ